MLRRQGRYLGGTGNVNGIDIFSLVHNSNGTCPLVGYHYNVQNLVNIVKERNNFVQSVRDLYFERAF